MKLSHESGMGGSKSLWQKVREGLSSLGLGTFGAIAVPAGLQYAEGGQPMDAKVLMMSATVGVVPIAFASLQNYKMAQNAPNVRADHPMDVAVATASLWGGVLATAAVADISANSPMISATAGLASWTLFGCAVYTTGRAAIEQI